jgi:hypothetical protein
MSAVWRFAKVLLAAWAFAVAGVIVCFVVSTIVAGSSGADWVREHIPYFTLGLFLIGIPVMLRWLR